MDERQLQDLQAKANEFAKNQIQIFTIALQQNQNSPSLAQNVPAIIHCFERSFNLREMTKYMAEKRKITKEDVEKIYNNAMLSNPEEGEAYEAYAELRAKERFEEDKAKAKEFAKKRVTHSVQSLKENKNDSPDAAKLSHGIIHCYSQYFTRREMSNYIPVKTALDQEGAEELYDAAIKEDLEGSKAYEVYAELREKERSENDSENIFAQFSKTLNLHLASENEQQKQISDALERISAKSEKMNSMRTTDLKNLEGRMISRIDKTYNAASELQKFSKRIEKSLGDQLQEITSQLQKVDEAAQIRENKVEAYQCENVQALKKITSQLQKVDEAAQRREKKVEAYQCALEKLTSQLQKVDEAAQRREKKVEAYQCALEKLTSQLQKVDEAAQSREKKVEAYQCALEKLTYQLQKVDEAAQSREKKVEAYQCENVQVLEKISSQLQKVDEAAQSREKKVEAYQCALEKITLEKVSDTQKMLPQKVSTDHLAQLVFQKKYETSFGLALLSTDSMLSWLCKEAKLLDILKEKPLPLSPFLLLKLFHRLGSSIEDEILQKVKWMVSVFDGMPSEYKCSSSPRPVMLMAYQDLCFYMTRSNDDEELHALGGLYMILSRIVGQKPYQ